MQDSRSASLRGRNFNVLALDVVETEGLREDRSPPHLTGLSEGAR